MPTAAQLLKRIAELQSNLKVAKAKEQEELEKEIAKIRPRADALLQEKFGYTLAQIFTARDPNKSKPRTEYVHPETKEVFVPGKGKKRPDWVKEMETA
jgi:hypothetical protein